MPIKDPDPARRDLHIPTRTIAKVLATSLLVYVGWTLSPLAMLLFLAVLVAVTLQPVVTWLRKRGCKQWVAVLIVAMGLVVVVGGGMVLIVPPLIEQGTGLIKSLPKLRDAMLEQVPGHGYLHDTISGLVDGKNLPDPSVMLKYAVSWGGEAIELLTWLAMILILAIYLLLDGERLYRWLLPYAPPASRERVAMTLTETSEVIFAYMAGQVITSVICSIYAFGVLLALHVPAALILAVIAGIFDVIPIVGFFLAVVPAVLLGLTVSPTTALLVFLLYVLYHVIENYVLVPMVYGNRLRLSTLSVLIALLAGGLLAGILGAIAVLPLVASYPIIERIWLKPYLGREVVRKHAEQMAEEAQGVPPAG